MKEKNKQKGITLVALVITIVILLILVGVAISSLSSSGLINRAIQAREEMKISEYTEKIELIKSEVRLSKSNPAEIPTLNELKDSFDNENWVDSTEIIIDNDIEKLKLITKEGYIFYITVNKTEYKGKGIVVDTSALVKDDVLKLEITTTTENGRMVKITDITGVDYYKIQYQIGSEDGDWTEIQSENEVEVPFGEIIYARLIYGTNYGVTYRMSVAHTNPTLTVSTDDYSNVTRKTDVPLSDLFQVTWGSEGVGKCYYFVKGNLKFNNTDVNYNANEITNLSELELGTYTIGCGVATPTQVKNNQYEIGSGHYITVDISKLANTTVTNSNDESVEAYAICSKYDLAYFRDLVNDGQSSINAKQMEDIDLRNICYKTDGTTTNDVSWEPIGNYGTDTTHYFSGTFNGNNHIIDYLYINNTNDYQGLFGYVLNGNITGVVIGENSSIKGNSYVGGIVSGIENSTISNCGNNANITGTSDIIGGITGICVNSEIISTYNKGDVTSNGNKVAGIASYLEATTTNNGIKYSYNTGNITGAFYVGGIIGSGGDYSIMYNCYNKGIIQADSASNNSAFLGGIAGRLRAYGLITYCYNLGSVKNTSSGKNVGGIVGLSTSTDGTTKTLERASTVSYSYNAGNLTSEGTMVGGICGRNDVYCCINNCYISNTIAIKYNTTSATENIGSTSNYLGKIVGMNSASSGNISNVNALSSMPTVYNVVNGLSDGESSYWSYSNLNEPKLLWEKEEVEI